jgi:hypothetical protein
MMMAGRLGEWSVEDLLQIARITQKTTSIEIVTATRSGVVYLRQGRLVDAELHPEPVGGGDHASRIVEALYVLSAMRDGTFEFGTRPVPPSGPSIEVKTVLDAVEKDMQREKRLADMGIASSETLGVAAEITDPLTLQPLMWRLLTDLIAPFSVETLERRIGRRKAVATVLMLEVAGVLTRRGEPLIVEQTPEPAGEQPTWGNDVSSPDEPGHDHPAHEDGPPYQGRPDAAPSQQEGRHQPSGQPADQGWPQPSEQGWGEPTEPASDQGWPESEHRQEPGEPSGPTSDQGWGESSEQQPQGGGEPSPTEGWDEPRDDGWHQAGEPRAWDETEATPTGRDDDEGPSGIVEIFGHPARTRPMHEVVAPSETTLIPGVLSDMTSRFRSGKLPRSDDEDPD